MPLLTALVNTFFKKIGKFDYFCELGQMFDGNLLGFQ